MKRSFCFTVEDLKKKGYVIRNGEVVRERSDNRGGSDPVNEEQPPVCKIQEQKHHKPTKTEIDIGNKKANALFVKAEIADNRRRDLDGMLNTLQDSLVKEGIIEDDSTKHIDCVIIFCEKSGQHKVIAKIIEGNYIKKKIKELWKSI